MLGNQKLRYRLEKIDMYRPPNQIVYDYFTLAEIESGAFWKKIQGCVILQRDLCTNKKDKSDVMLYENDIIEAYWDGNFENGDYLGVIELQNDDWCINFLSHGVSIGLNHFESNEIKMIKVYHNDLDFILNQKGKLNVKS